MTCPPDTVLQQLGLSTPLHIAETAIANVWKVTRAGGGHAALKIYKNGDPKGEDIGFRLTKALNGQGTAKTFYFAQDVAVLEWLDGPSLGDLSRSGQDDKAAAELINVADQIHTAPTHLDLPSLADNFSPLMALQIARTWPAQTQKNIGRARGIAQHLLANQQEIRALHGDLHHDNIKGTAQGYRAYDAKGLIGDRAYELANAFQNPLGSDDLVTDPARARRLTDTWAQHWNTTPTRLLSWAAAHSALSMTWARNFEQPLHMEILDMLCELASP